jgi:integrase
MARRSNGEGTIIQRKDGRWQASIRLNEGRRTVYGKTEREARAKLRELQRQIDTTGALPNPGRRTVAELVEAWLDSASVKPTTAAQYRMFFDTYVRAELGSRRLMNVTPSMIQRLYGKLSPSVGTHVHAVLHRAFAVAVVWGWLPSNPCDRVLKPVHRAARKTLWTRAELDTFLDGTADYWLHPLWVLLVGTGCRLGEALALRWDGVGMGVALNVDGTLHRLEGDWVVSEPKTPSAVRTVLLLAAATDALHRQKTQQDAWQDAAGSSWLGEGFVFTGETGKPLFRSTVEHAMKRECKRLDLPPMTPHGLRHLHASLLLGEGIPVTAVSARLGHANPQITLTTYAHALAGQDSLAAQAISGVLGRPRVPELEETVDAINQGEQSEASDIGPAH